MYERQKKKSKGHLKTSQTNKTIIKKIKVTNSDMTVWITESEIIKKSLNYKNNKIYKISREIKYNSLNTGKYNHRKCICVVMHWRMCVYVCVCVHERDR